MQHGEKRENPIDNFIILIYSKKINHIVQTNVQQKQMTKQ